MKITHVAFTHADGWHLIADHHGDGWCIPTDRATVARLYLELRIPFEDELEPKVKQLIAEMRS